MVHFSLDSSMASLGEVIKGLFTILNSFET